ncbi:uncharacterized protein [Watersipora subatra]|uniref:uncharacterized protein n=1 Tax=Watersipora subatra TaxID=2589382 RepID=UPI00355BF418
MEGGPYHLKTMTADGKVCKPSRKTFERQCKQLAEEIRAVQIKLADTKAQLNELYSRLHKLREERNAKFTEKSVVEDCVKDMSVNINKLTDNLSQLQSKLHYRDMQKLEDAIRTLQNHLDSRHFKHSEEKKIVAEIDKLNRSKKVVGVYLETQKELRELRTGQHGKRVDRDKLIKDIVAIRKQEEETRGKLTTIKSLESQLKTDAEELNQQKDLLKSEFTKHQQAFAVQKAALKQAELECRQKQQQAVARSATCRCLGEVNRVVDVTTQTPEMINCQKLIEFCERLSKALGDDRAAQRQKKKKISYTTDILAQFVSINVCPPMTVAQASTCLPVLQQKLTDLKQLHCTVITEEPVENESKNDPSVAAIPAIELETVPSSTEEIGHTDIASDDDDGILAEHPDDQSDRSSLSKQLSTASDEDTIESMKYKMNLLDSLFIIADQKAEDSSIA